MKRTKLTLRRDTLRLMAGSDLVRARGAQDDNTHLESFVYSCLPSGCGGTTCQPSMPNVCPMGPTER